MQVLSLYAKMMAWLEGADPTICVQTNTWTAAALQLAIQFYKVLHWDPATCIHACMLLIHLKLMDRPPPVPHHIAVLLDSAEQRPDVSALSAWANVPMLTRSMCVAGQCATEPPDNTLWHRGSIA